MKNKKTIKNKKASIYFIGIAIKNKQTLTVQARRSKDFLSCELIDYFGERITTKKGLKERLTSKVKKSILADYNKRFANNKEYNFKYIQVD